MPMSPGCLCIPVVTVCRLIPRSEDGREALHNYDAKVTLPRKVSRRLAVAVGRDNSDSTARVCNSSLLSLNSPEGSLSLLPHPLRHMIFITSHQLHVIVMPTSFQALDKKTTTQPKK